MILLYHKVYAEAKTPWWVTSDAFYLQMHDLQTKKVVYLDEYDPSDPDQCVITFDGVYDNLWKYAVPILKHFDYPFELFIVGGSVGQGNEFDVVEPYAPFADKETLGKMIAAGGRLQWHTWSHPVLVGKHPSETYKRELMVPDDLRSLDPNGFKWFGYPHGQRDNLLKAETRKYYQGALACDDGDPYDVYDLQRIIVYETTRFTKSKVSLIIPCYNYGHFAAEAIESALYQIYPPDEILFIDDHSSDNSVEVAKHYEPDIKVEINSSNLGIIQNFSKAVEMTSGDYICFLGADNRFRSDYVDKAKTILDMNPDVGVAYTNFALFGDRANAESLKMGAHPHPKTQSIFLKNFPEYPEKNIKQENYIHGSSMYRRTAYRQAGGYSDASIPEDHFLFARILAEDWKARLLNDYVLEYRQHSKDQINQLRGLEIENVHLRNQHAAAIQKQMELHNALQAVLNSRSWKFILRLQRIRQMVIPPNSGREKLMIAMYRTIKKIFK